MNKLFFSSDSVRADCPRCLTIFCFYLSFYSSDRIISQVGHIKDQNDFEKWMFARCRVAHSCLVALFIATQPPITYHSWIKCLLIGSFSRAFKTHTHTYTHKKSKLTKKINFRQRGYSPIFRSFMMTPLKKVLTRNYFFASFFLLSIDWTDIHSAPWPHHLLSSSCNDLIISRVAFQLFRFRQPSHWKSQVRHKELE